MYCPNCGKEVVDGAKFCENCGTPIEQKQQENTYQPINKTQQEPKKKSNKTQSIVMIVVALLVAAGVYYFISSPSSSDEKEAYAFLDERFEELNDKDFKNYWKSYSPKAIEKIANNYGVSSSYVKAAAYQNQIKYNVREFKVISKTQYEDKKCWGYVYTNKSDVNGQKNLSAQDTLYAYKEDGKWVVCSKQEFDSSFVDE